MRTRAAEGPGVRQGERTGVMEIQREGYGFVILDPKAPGAPPERDVFVPIKSLGGAMHGDRVRLRVQKGGRESRPSGVVLAVLERSLKRAVGRLRMTGGMVWLTPFDLRLPPLRVENPARGLRPGAIADATLTRYPTERSPEAFCRIDEVLGLENEAGVDLEVVIRKYAIPHDFPPEALAQAERLPENPAPADFRGREDFTKIRVVTIDGADARDFDDAISIEQISGGFRLGVHIADVAHYVPIGSPLDMEARLRGNSVYFTEAVIPMFPEALSNGLCSLRPNVPRLVQSVLMDFDRRGIRRGPARFADGVIQSAQRMVYEDVAALMEGDAAMRRRYREHVADFEAFTELYRALEARRRERGSLDFDLPEAQITLAPGGGIASISPRPRTDAHKLIEEFMLAANESVAEFLTKARPGPAVYRVHEPPQEKKLEALTEFLRSLGVALPPRPSGPSPRELQRVLEKFAGTPDARIVHYAILRSMMQARYATANLGHFGLALKLYTHFTSPIRRYPDLLVHRLLRSRRTGRGLPHAFLQQLDALCESSSLAERRAMYAERELLEWKQARYMREHVGRRYQATVTGVTRQGLFVQLHDLVIEGLVPQESLPPGNYTFDPARHALTGRGGIRWRLGDHVEVEAAGVDDLRRQPLFRMIRKI